jgi:hypothetical protein
LFDKFLGITLDNGVAGYQVEVKHAGIVTNPTWTWGTGSIPLFLGASGAIVDGVPNTAMFEQELAISVGNTSLYIQPKDCILKNYRTAATALSSQRVVSLNASGQAQYANSVDVTHANRVEGFTKTAVGAGERVDVLTSGELTNAGWSWVMGAPIFFDAIGRPTQTAPVTGFQQVVGMPTAATKLRIAIGMPVILA